MTLLETIGNDPFWFEVMDDYSGPEAERADYLASQWTFFGEEISADEWGGLLTAAEHLITEWRARKSIARIAAVPNLDTPIRTVRRVA